MRVEARGLADIDQAFAAMARPERGRGVRAAESTLTGFDRALERIVELLASLVCHRRPTRVTFAQGGGLLSLGMDEPAVYPGAAQYIDRILQRRQSGRAAGRAALEVRPAVNLKTAQQLGITIPPSILLRADEVIE